MHACPGSQAELERCASRALMPQGLWLLQPIHCVREVDERHGDRAVVSVGQLEIVVTVGLLHIVDTVTTAASFPAMVRGGCSRRTMRSNDFASCAWRRQPLIQMSRVCVEATSTS